MRKQTTITVNDGGNELTFKITQLSAMQLEIFLLKTTKLLAKAGLLDAPLSGKDGADAMGEIANLLLNNLPQALGGLDVEDASALIGDLVEKCVEKVDGKLLRRMSPDEVDAVISTLPALFELQKQTVIFNLDFLVAGNLSNAHTSNQTVGITSNQKISLR